MIDLNLYRYIVGVYNSCKHISGSKSVSMAGNFGTDTRFLSIVYLLFYLTIYMYFAICMWGMIICMLRECKFRSFPINRFHIISDTELIHSYLTHSKVLSVVLMYYVLKRDVLSFRFFGIYFGLLSKLMFHGISCKKSVTNLSTFPLITQNIAVLCSGCLMWIVSLNSILIVIVNPSILNPGPRPPSSISVTSFNVHGLIPFSQLNEAHPSLDVTKLHELNFYLSDSKPDILMLNETWLKKTVLDSEIFPLDYKIFRLDRSPKTHPPDPNNPDKFRKNGGGVLIAIRRDLDIVSTKLDFSCSAEILGITLKFKDGRKIILCSFYRVGNLGVDNHNEFCDYVRKARRRRGVWYSSGGRSKYA